MDVPTVVAEALDDEAVAAAVPLKGEDTLYVTRSRTLVYKSEGLLSDESVSDYPHDAERIEVDEGRRKATVSLSYGTRGEASFSVPASTLDDVLHPVLAGVLNAADVTEPGETVKRTFRFGDLTLVVTSDRVVKHVGSAIWDPEYEEVPYESVSDLSVEEGNVSSQLVLRTGERTERIKAPNEGFREVAETVQEALFAYHDVDSLEAFRTQQQAEAEAAAAEAGTEEVAFEDSVDPIGADEEAVDQAPEGEETAAKELEESGFTSAAAKVETTLDGEALAAELDALEAAIENQRETLDAQVERINAIRDLIPDQ
jgi:hypothetical protein